MAQSYGRWGGKDVARDLLKTRQRSWYSVGTTERSAVSTWNTEDKEPGDKAAPKQDRTDSKITQNSLTNPHEGCAAPTTYWRSGVGDRGEEKTIEGTDRDGGRERNGGNAPLRRNRNIQEIALSSRINKRRTGVNGVLIFDGDREQGTRLGGLWTWRSTHQNPPAYWWAPSVIWSYFLDLVRTLTAAFCTICSLFIEDAGQPPSSALQ